MDRFIYVPTFNTMILNKHCRYSATIVLIPNVVTCELYRCICSYATQVLRYVSGSGVGLYAFLCQIAYPNACALHYG
jgi:hypothetical protein